MIKTNWTSEYYGLAYYPLHRIEFGPSKFFSKTCKFSIIFYSTLQFYRGGHFRKACRSRKKESKQSEITCKQSEPARTISKIQKREEFVRALCYEQCPKNSFKRLYIVKGGPEPLENEINKILGSKREDRFSDNFSDLVQNICSVRFSYLLCLSIFCKAPQDMRKFPQKCQKIAGCWESAIYGSRPLITSKPDSSPPDRPDLDNITSQPWSEATCPCTTSASAYVRFVTIFLLDKTRQSTRSCGTGASCVRPWLTRDIV